MSDTPLPKSDHLLLLVGGNPLPAAVAGRLLAADNAVISLVCSKGSATPATQLAGWLRSQRPSLQIDLVEVEEANPISIHREITKRLAAVARPSVGLNYTGGTKAMSVHAYQAVQRWAPHVRPVFSYLNARTLEMVFDPDEPGEGDRPQEEYVGRAVTLTFEDLIRLHGWTLPGAIRDQPLLPETAQELVAVHASPPSHKAWQRWKAEFLCPARDHRAPLELPQAPSLQPVVAALREEVPLDPQGRIPADLLKPSGADIYSWLDGNWLEEAVLLALLDCQARCGVHQLGTSLKAVTTGGIQLKFEFDVAAMRGYQLFGFSCSIKGDDKGEYPVLKQKLFEAIIRARQLGGDEARIALVCCRSNVSALEQEVHRDIDPDGRTRVFGRQHLGDLSGEIAAWIRDQSGRDLKWSW